MARTANEVYRDFATDGVPSSGPQEPRKLEIRELLTGYESIISAFVSGTGTIFVSKASMDANLNYPQFTMAWVLGDPVAANNGVYRKINSPGLGSWVRTGDLPYSFIAASDVGAGTPNAIQATSSIPISGSALVWMNVFEANTSSPVTVSFNGGSALTVKTNTGNDVAAGGLTSGMIVLGIVSGGVFRLVSDQASAAVVAAAEAAQAAAEDARDDVANIAGSIVSEQPSRAYATASYHPTTAPDFIRTAGYYVAGDLGGALYKKAASEPSHIGKFSITLLGVGTTVWYELAETEVCPEHFGAKGDSDGTVGGGTNDLAAFQAAVDFSKRVFLNTNRNYRLHGSLSVPRFTSIIGYNMSNSDTGSLTSAPKLIFTGSGTACIQTKAADDLSSHSKICGFVLRDVSAAGYTYLMNFKQCIEMTFADLKIESINTATHGFRAYKDNLSDVSWSNRMSNVKVRLPDQGTARTLDVNWSDSTAEDCQFTGGLGAIDRGIDVRYVACQFERSDFAGMTCTKTASTKRSFFIGCNFDGNWDVGLRFETDLDVSTTYHIESVVIGNTFRTLDPNIGTPGIADIQFINDRAGQVYMPPPVIGNTFQAGAAERWTFSGSGGVSGLYFASGTFVGNKSRDFNAQNFNIEDDNLVAEPTGILVPRGMVAARGQRTVYGQTNVSGAFGNDTTGAAFAVLGHDGTDAFVGASKTSGNANQGLAFKVKGQSIMRITPDGDFLQLFTDVATSLGTGSARFLNTFSANFRPGPSGTAIWTAGTGSPEGVVTAPIGSLFTRLDGSTTTTLYVKTSGSGNTGWTAK